MSRSRASSRPAYRRHDCTQRPSWKRILLFSPEGTTPRTPQESSELGGSAAHPLRGVVIMTFVATASVTEAVPRTPASRPNLVSVGTIIWLSSELMFFAALFAMYFTIRSVDKGQGLQWPHDF